MAWEYEQHPNRHTVTESCKNLQLRVTSNQELINDIVSDTRPFHKEIFIQVTPLKMQAYAGNYRSNFEYLKNYAVIVGQHCGCKPELVEEVMDGYHKLFKKHLQKFNNLNKDKSKTEKFVIYSRLISIFVVEFLSIHPYANGNGHISRLIAWALFCYKGFAIKSWDLDRRPDQPFDKFIAEYQQGNQAAMAGYFQSLLQDTSKFNGMCC